VRVSNYQLAKITEKTTYAGCSAAVVQTTKVDGMVGRVLKGESRL